MQNRDGFITTYTYNNRDQLKTESNTKCNTNYDYDRAGRLLSKVDSSGTTSYTWVDEDRLEAVNSPNGTINYTYDYQGIRVAAGNKNYLVDKQLTYGQVICEYENISSLKCGYVYGLERISQTRNGNVQYYVADGQGSIRQLTNAAGNVTDTYFYTAFGEDLAHTGTTVNEFRYVGEQWDAGVNNYHLRAIWYDPSSGRFASVDPFVGDPQAPVSLHRYLYGNASPITFGDPTGRFTIGQALTAVAIVGILVDIKIVTTRLFQPQSVLWKWHKTRLDAYVEFGGIKDVVNNAIGVSTFGQFAIGRVGQSVNQEQRYIYSKRYAWIDLQHVVSAYSAPLFAQGFALGLLIEQSQAITHPFSAFQVEDLVSNLIGNIASGVFGPDPGSDVTEIIGSYSQPILSKSEAEKELKEKCGIR